MSVPTYMPGHPIRTTRMDGGQLEGMFLEFAFGKVQCVLYDPKRQPGEKWYRASIPDGEYEFLAIPNQPTGGIPWDQMVADSARLIRCSPSHCLISAVHNPGDGSRLGIWQLPAILATAIDRMVGKAMEDSHERGRQEGIAAGLREALATMKRK